MAVDGLDLVARAQAGLFWPAFRAHLLDTDRARHDLGKDAGVAEVEVLAPWLWRAPCSERLRPVAAAIDGDGNGLAGIQLGAFADLLPVGIVDGVEMADDVAGLKAGLGRGRTGGDPLDRRLA